MFPEQPAMNREETPEHQLKPYVRPAQLDLQIKDDLDHFALDFGQKEFASLGPFYIFGARQGFYGTSDWLNDISFTFSGIRLVVRSVRDVQQDGDEASATIEYNFELTEPETITKQALAGWESARWEKVQFYREKRGNNQFIWKIVPPETLPRALTTDREMPQDDNFWNTAAYYLAQKQPYQRTFTPTERSIRNLKNLGLGALMFATDYDNLYALDGRYIAEALNFYLPQIDADKFSTFRVPDTNEIYTFNGNLSGLKTDEVKTPTQTVLFYEGQNETPIFRYDGKAAICFADGHVALVSPDEAKSLIWKP